MKKNREFFVEFLNSISHFIGVGIGIVFLVMMIRSCIKKGNAYTPAFIIYGAFFIFLFLASTLYHGIWNKRAKNILRIFDHSAIFLFIAASFTPVILTVLSGKKMIFFLVLIWVIALAGTIYKILSYGKYDKQKTISVILYIAMGWTSIFLLKPIFLKMPREFLFFLVAGGILYTVGTIFYKMKKQYSHVIWHFFVLGAAITHFIGYYQYLI
ncbi:hemolysin III family protein [Peptoniphilus sp. AGMB00490]|uniref:Hemolysin III family protein n=2 Tax=Peptoniphilus TaxID=162289 RepID=A0ACD6AZX7_9FIRM|nr:MULTISPECIES: hemolysin III family protein [Peptoniphilus]NMW85783.1 hemolysin III family protein [Peptoniphilus faecalis]OLR65515.1 hemolysin III family protein [Peptoniphilus porci]